MLLRPFESASRSLVKALNSDTEADKPASFQLRSFHKPCQAATFHRHSKLLQRRCLSHLLQFLAILNTDCNTLLHASARSASPRRELSRQATTPALQSCLPVTAPKGLASSETEVESGQRHRGFVARRLARRSLSSPSLASLCAVSLPTEHPTIKTAFNASMGSSTCSVCFRDILPRRIDTLLPSPATN
jgi:hypothetical protein